MTIEKRLSEHSSNEKVFYEAAPVYEKALQDAGYDKKLTFNPTNVPKNQKNRKRNIIWFNPPYSKNVETKIGKTFLKLIDKHFPKKHKYHKIFNRNTIKVSYSCTKNMKTIINSHNKQIIQTQENNLETKNCNCTKKMVIAKQNESFMKPQ